MIPDLDEEQRELHQANYMMHTTMSMKAILEGRTPTQLMKAARMKASACRMCTDMAADIVFTAVLSLHVLRTPSICVRLA